MKIIILIIFTIGFIIFLANEITALVTVKELKIKGFFHGILLFFCGFSTLMVFIIFLLFMLDSIMNDNKKKVKYIPVQEQLYKIEK